MRNPRFVVVAALALLLAAARSRGQDEKGKGPRLPINPFADASVGDWAVLCWKAGKETRTYEWKIEKVEGDQVTLSERDTAEKDAEPTIRKFSKAEAPTVDDYTGMDEAVQLSPGKKMKTADEEREAGGKKFKCKKLTLPGTDSDAELWVSSEARLGWVELRIKEGDETKIEIVIVGFGTKAKTEWGLTAAQFAAMPKDLKLTECGKNFGLDIFAADGWNPEVVNDTISWSKEGYMGSLCLRSTKKWMDAKMNDRKGIESEDDLKDYQETHSGKVEKLESKTKTEKGWHVIAKGKGSGDKETTEFLYVMKLGGEPFLFVGSLTPREEGETIKLEEALKIAETVKVHGK